MISLENIGFCFLSLHNTHFWHFHCSKGLQLNKKACRMGCRVTAKRKIDQVLNVVGLLQPQSNFLVSKTLEKVAEGGIVEVISNERNSMNILTGLCPKGKYKITETREVRGLFHYIIVKKKSASLLRE